MLEYKNLILQDRVAPGMTVKKALGIYKKFHFLSRVPTWGRIPFSCSCAVCFPNCVCQDTILFASLFDQEVRVPDSWVTATVSVRKVQKAIGGTAGRKQRLLIEQRACYEKTIDSKVNHLIDAEPQEPAPAPKLVVPEAVLPSSSDDDFKEDTHVAANRMPD